MANDSDKERKKISDAKKRANKKWNDANMKERYDRIQLVVRKGKKKLIQACADAHDESINGLINKLLDEEIARLGIVSSEEPEL